MYRRRSRSTVNQCSPTWGAETTSNYIHNNLDDGIEHFGSADFVRHAVLTGNADDSGDGTGDHGIEADNDKTNRARRQPDAGFIEE